MVIIRAIKGKSFVKRSNCWSKNTFTQTRVTNYSTIQIDSRSILNKYARTFEFFSFLSYFDICTHAHYCITPGQRRTTRTRNTPLMLAVAPNLPRYFFIATLSEESCFTLLPIFHKPTKTIWFHSKKHTIFHSAVYIINFYFTTQKHGGQSRGSLSPPLARTSVFSQPRTPMACHNLSQLLDVKDPCDQ